MGAGWVGFKVLVCARAGQAAHDLAGRVRAGSGREIVMKASLVLAGKAQPDEKKCKELRLGRMHESMASAAFELTAASSVETRRTTQAEICARGVQSEGVESSGSGWLG